MHPGPFRYHRAASLEEAADMLQQLGQDARPLAGGQSLVPLMKLRLARPSDLVDLAFVPGLSYVRPDGNEVRFGALTRHAEIADSDAAARFPILHDCAAGIGDVQVRNRGTIGGSLAEADPSGDWAPVLLTHATEIRCLGPGGERTLPLREFILDAYTTALGPGELVREIVMKAPAHASDERIGGAYIAAKRCAQVYATASAAVRLTLAGDVCRDAAIFLGAVGLTAIEATEAADALRDRALDQESIEAAVKAAAAAGDPQPDMRGSAEYKRVLTAALVKRAIQIAARRARGEHVEVSHVYA
jgi:aerobic carbon-monoxide dehydrogenase medium subunit